MLKFYIELIILKTKYSPTTFEPSTPTQSTSLSLILKVWQAISELRLIKLRFCNFFATMYCHHKSELLCWLDCLEDFFSTYNWTNIKKHLYLQKKLFFYQLCLTMCSFTLFSWLNNFKIFYLQLFLRPSWLHVKQRM